jgi:hypothetical protein
LTDTNFAAPRLAREQEKEGMHIRSKVMQLWWPTTQCLDIVEGPAEVVAEAVHTEVSRWVS